VVERRGEPFEAEMIKWLPFNTTQRGALEATVDWTFASNDVDVYLVQGQCDFDRLVALQCPVLAFSESTTAKPERARVADAAAGAYTIFIANIGPGEESVSFQVVLTPSGSASASDRRTAGLGVRPRIRPRSAQPML
jgi:hypothetical protein